MIDTVSSPVAYESSATPLGYNLSVVPFSLLEAKSKNELLNPSSPVTTTAFVVSLCALAAA